MGYEKIDELAINTIRTLAVSGIFLPHRDVFERHEKAAIERVLMKTCNE
jgi:hypothetical protein